MADIYGEYYGGYIDSFVYNLVMDFLGKYFAAIGIIALIGGLVACFCMIFLRKKSKYYVGPKKAKVMIIVLITVACVATVVYLFISIFALMRSAPYLMYLLEL